MSPVWLSRLTPPRSVTRSSNWWPRSRPATRSLPAAVRVEESLAGEGSSVAVEDLVAELEAADEALSGQVNEAIRAEIERRRRNRLLTVMLDSLDAKYGPVDEALVAKYTELL